MSFLNKLLSGPALRGMGAFLLIGLFSAIVSLLLYSRGYDFVNLVDLKARDAFVRARGVSVPSDKVVIVSVDEKSVNELGRWPWPRARMAELLRALDGAGVVAFDMVFSEAENSENDGALADAVSSAGNVVLGYFFRHDATGVPPEESLLQHKRSKVSVVRYLDAESEGKPLPLVEFKGIEPNIPEIGRGAAGFGTFTIFTGDDGILRESNLLYRFEDTMYPVLSIEALRKFTGEDIVVTAAAYGVDSISIGGHHVPLDKNGEFALNFYGPGETFPIYSIVDVIKGRLPKETFAGKLVFVGATEVGIYDLRATPMDPVYPGVEVHATIASNVLQGRYLTSGSSSFVLSLTLMLVLPVLLSLILSRVHRTYVSLIIFSGALVLLVSGLFFIFSAADLVVSFVYPGISLTLAYIFTEAYRNVVVEKKSKFYRKAFSTYVPPQLVNEILKDPESLKLGGQKRVITVLFSDIRGFTSIAEKLAPEELVAQLNDYLTPMTKVIFNEQGTLDKYIGDAIMAIFNAPLDLVDHPRRACAAALSMLGRLPALNAVWENRGLPTINIGIGLNTGEAVVGNMGADLRFDYTAIGDTVNLSSRLEGMNKVYGTGIIVSISTFSEVEGEFVFRELDLVRVKGKQRPVAIYELLGHAGSATESSLASKFAGALVNYRKGKFRTARGAFEGILKEHPGDGPSRLYIKRCDEFLAEPPPMDWDGVYMAKSK